jgi:NDP-sugar pyrophosphorylase family protein
MAAGEDVLAYEVKGLWLDSGSLSDYLGATKAVLQLLPRLQHQPFFLSLFRRFWARFDQRPNLWEGEGCEHLIELGAKNHTLMGQNCKIHTSVHLQGFAVFGDGCQIEKDVVIKNSVIGAGVHVPAGAKITDSLVLK